MMKIRYRFPKFHLDWKEDEFKGIFDFHQTNTFSRSQMNNRRGFARNIHYGDILTKYGNILSDLQEVPYINKDISLLKVKEESYLQNGDIIIADTAEDLTVGKAMEVQNIDGKILSGLHTILCRPKFKFAPRFLGYNLNSSSYRRNLIPLVVGVKVCSISKTNISKTLVMYPDDINEQQKIADCLSSIDDLISAEEKKLSLLNDYKKGWIQKLFPAEGKTVPEWRFPEFMNSGDWEENSLKKVLIKNSMKNKNQKYSLIESISNKFGFVRQDKYFENRRVASKNTSNYYVIKKGYFAYNPSRIDVGSLAYKYDDRTSIISPLYVSFKANNDVIDDIFLWMFFNSISFTKQMIFEGGVRNTLNYENLIQIKIFLPNLPEQQKIAGFLSGIDDLINKQTDKIKILKQHKKALTQGLFPAVEEVL